MDIKELFSIPSLIGTFDVSPDQKHAAVIWDRTGRWEVYLVPLDRSRKIIPLTSNGASHVAPRFSPDGTRLAFSQDYDGDECFDIFIHDLRSGETRNLLPDTPTELVNANISWSPDCREIAFVSNRDGKLATYAITTDGANRVRRITNYAYPDIVAEWSPDGKYLAVTTWTAGQDTGVFVIPSEGGEGKGITLDGKLIDAFQPSWSADSKRVVFGSNAPGMMSIGAYDVVQNSVEWLVRAKWDAAEARLSPDGSKLAFTLNEGGNLRLAVQDSKTRRYKFHDVEAGVHWLPHWLDEERLLVMFNSATRPNDLWLIDLKKETRQMLTHSLPKKFKPSDFIAPRVVRWKSDEFTVSGLLFLPRGARRRSRRPAVIVPHGGPTAQMQNTWYPQLQQLVGEGYIVLCPNYRGSTGYGKGFQEANRLDLGGGDMRDVIRGAQYLVRRGLADAKRIAISGVSYGGYLTMTALTKHPDVFAAGAAIVPFLNWFTEYANEREDLKYWDEQNFGHPERDAARYREYSPIFFMENIVAPVQMIAGAQDPRCPAEETRQAVEALRSMGVPYEAIVFPDEGHGFRKTENKIRAYQARADFLKKHLLMGRAGSSPRRR